MISATGETLEGYPGTYRGVAPSYSHAQPFLQTGSAPPIASYYPPSGQVIQDMNHTGEKAGYPGNFPGGALSYAYAQPSVGFQQPILPPVSAPPIAPYYPPSGQVIQDMNKTGEKAGYPGNFPGGALSYAYAQPSVGFQLPIPPPGSAPPTGSPYSPHSGQAVPVAQVPLRTEDPLPCCGIGLGWFLFILGFFLGIIPWFVGAAMLCRVQGIDKRERPGYIACAIAAIIGVAIAVLITVLLIQAANRVEHFSYNDYYYNHN